MHFNWDKAGLRITMMAHLVLYIMVTGGLITLCINEPWYYSVLMCTFFFSPAMAGIFCAFNNLDNYFRMRLGLDLIEDDALSFYLRKLRSGKGSVIKII